MMTSQPELIHSYDITGINTAGPWVEDPDPHKYYRWIFIHGDISFSLWTKYEIDEGSDNCLKQEYIELKVAQLGEISYHRYYPDPEVDKTLAWLNKLSPQLGDSLGLFAQMGLYKIRW